jgi:hypothetical protein
MGLEPGQVKEAMEKSANLGAILAGLRAAGSRALPWLASKLPTRAGLGRMLGTAGTAATAGTLGFLGSGTAYNAIKDIGAAQIGLGGAAGLAGGAGLGYGLAKLHEEDVDDDAIKAKELADTYKVYSDRLKAQKAYKQYRQAREAI